MFFQLWSSWSFRPIAESISWIMFLPQVRQICLKKRGELANIGHEIVVTHWYGYTLNLAVPEAHRGPDGEGFYTDSFIRHGHRRPAIIDISPAGHQPMITEDRKYVFTYNGEGYNFQELRAELQSLGHRFLLSDQIRGTYIHTAVFYFFPLFYAIL